MPEEVVGNSVAVNREVIEHADGRVEMVDSTSVESSPLYNHDLAPVPVSKRTWNTYNYAALWTGMSASIPAYMLSSGLMAQGMNWWQALLTILVGNLLVLLPILANSHPGTKYGIPFPVFARASYGVIGSNLPALMRAVVACGWFGIQAWIGGHALDTFMSAIVPGWHTLLGGPVYDGHTPTEWLSFLVFWALNIFVIFHGMEVLKKFENLAAPFVLVMTALLVAWALNAAHGLGALVHEHGKFNTLHEFIPIFIPSVMAMMGYWATLSLNMPDFTRFGKSQREQIAGQVAALPTVMTLFAAMGVIVTSAATAIYPNEKLSELWDPIKLIGHFNEPWLVAISMFTVVIATLSVNVAANVVSPANDFANAFPKYITFRRAGLITGIIGILMQPWRLLADPSGYIFSWLLGYSGGLGSIAGVMITDYWLVRKKRLELADLYLSEGAYTYSNGWNWNAVIATIAGCAFAWIGLVVPALKVIYDFGWFAGFAVSALVYVLLARRK
jgi:NCS1 family nucleobase:cation symporter-1